MNIGDTFDTFLDYHIGVDEELNCAAIVATKGFVRVFFAGLSAIKLGARYVKSPLLTCNRSWWVGWCWCNCCNSGGRWSDWLSL